MKRKNGKQKEKIKVARFQAIGSGLSQWLFSYYSIKKGIAESDSAIPSWPSDKKYRH